MDDRSGLNAIDRALTRALDVDVPADFASRVRRRIVADDPVASRFAVASAFRRNAWRSSWAFAAAAVLAVGVGLAVWPERPARSPRSLIGRALPVPLLRPAGGQRTFPLVPADPRAPAQRSRETAVTTSALPEPEVLVPAEELAMYRRLIGEAQKLPPAIVLDAPTEPVPVSVRSQISEIKIEPIRIDLMAPVTGAEGDRK